MKEITLTVIFEGTIFSIEEPNSHLHHVLYEDCDGVRIFSAEELNVYPDATHFKMGFNGCGVDYGIPGLLFGSGLETQYNQVAQVIKELIKAGHKVRLNSIGLSRGGVASLLLAKHLGDIDQFHLETNLLLLDPVPGNLSITSLLDYFNFTLANQAMDLSQSRNLKYVEALYPYLEVGDDSGDVVDQLLAHLHIPIRPTYPPQCEVREEVILGAHLNAFQDLSTVEEQKRAVHGIEIIPIIRQLSKEIINTFLRKVNALSKHGEEDDTPIIISRFIEEKDKWTYWLQSIITDIIPKDRSLHSQDNSRLSASNQGLFLNKTHRELLEIQDNNPELLSLKITPERPQIQIPQTVLTAEELCLFIQVIEASMTETSLQNKKGQLLRKLSNDLQEDNEFDHAALSFILRDIIAIALQRDRNSYSLFKQATSGSAIVTALNETGDQFEAIRQCIKPGNSLITYSDLSLYVAGRNDLNLFNSSNKDINLTLIESHVTGEDLYPQLII